MNSTAYEQRRSQIEHYFDRTAADAWARLTSNEPVGRIRATVRAGRDTMRATLLSWLPEDMRGLRLLDAGCGTGALALQAAQRGAEVIAIDLSPTLVKLAADRMAEERPQLAGSVTFLSGDMLSADLGTFDHVVCMDSLIHYDCEQIVQALASLAPRVRRSMTFTFAPRTPLLALMHSVGRLFPRSDRSPSLSPVAYAALQRQLQQHPGLQGWQEARMQRVARGFYTSQAWEWSRT
ncbi:MAG: magnesium protoporphyrin IX methyltransferase [Hylemonella sp.]|uniref:magnesium protoporphyrin IX methyltransferase n=1 Tax=Hylemonella sp. TaxID=2066020 RepID=UPI0022BDA191|nr:magnesium protoporphyrin IX methyltransferase [Hylemonella sp.]MCZ8253816.1 magnesium protoporphyrin IX methyltransferase [Hylemonella sp.]